VRRTNGNHRVVACSTLEPSRLAYSPQVESTSLERGSATLASTGGCNANATVDTATAGGINRRSDALGAEKLTVRLLCARSRYTGIEQLKVNLKIGRAHV